MSCTAAQHGTLTAYVKHGCRCPGARRAYSTYKRGWRANRAALGLPGGVPSMVPSTATIRLIRGLYHLGHSTGTIADTAGLSRNTISTLARQPLDEHHVQDYTARAVVGAARELAQILGRDRYSRHVREHATTAGWAPLHAWHRTHLPIADPTIPDEFAASVAHLPPPVRGLMLQQLRDAETAYRQTRKETAAA